jgi:hypothetical protein
MAPVPVPHTRLTALSTAADYSSIGVAFTALRLSALRAALVTTSSRRLQ